MRLHHKLFYLGACFVLALGGWTASAFIGAYYPDMALKLVGWMGALFGVPVALLWLAEWIAPAEPPKRPAG